MTTVGVQVEAEVGVQVVLRAEAEVEAVLLGLHGLEVGHEEVVHGLGRFHGEEDPHRSLIEGGLLGMNG